MLRAAGGRVSAIHFLFSAAYFAKQNTKLAAAKKARAGREFIFPTPLFLPALPERKSKRWPRRRRGLHQEFF
jgi:hypothetical protein